MLAQIGADSDTLEWDVQLDSVQNMVNVNLIEVLRAELRSSEEPPLSTVGLLVGSHKREVTEANDKIYGLFSLFPREMREALRDWVDPSRPERDTYVQFAKYYLRQDYSMLLFVTAQASRSPHGVRTQGLPSWCPDFNAPVSGAMFGLLNQYHAGYGIDADDCPDPGDFLMAVSSAADEVRVPGLTVDEISEVVLPDWQMPQGNTPIGRANAKKALEWDADCLALSMATTDSSDGRVPESHWRTLCADQLDPGTGYVRCGPKGAALYKKYKERLIALVAGEGINFNSCLEYATLIGSRALAHSFFSTKGRRVGLGPNGATAGDRVCIFRGGAAPFVLRKEGRLAGDAEFAESESVYNLVGDAYVHGVMYGELYPAVRSSDEVFVLR